MEILYGQTYYTVDEVMQMTHQHIEEEAARREWYNGMPEDSAERALFNERNSALHEYFRTQGATSEAVLLYESGLIEYELTENERTELDRYLEAKRRYEELNEKYVECYNKANGIKDERVS